MVNFLWSTTTNENIFSAGFGANRRRVAIAGCLRTSFRLFRVAHCVESLVLLFSTFRTFINIVRHRLERTIAGRPFVIEVTWVAEKRWRAHIVRIPGVPTAMMPFYGETPG